MLKTVLQIKIAITLFAWAIPFCLLPHNWFSFFGPVPHPILFVRLLGVAYFALVVAYGWGVLKLTRNESITGILLMGFVSNAGASLVIIIYHITTGWSGWTIWGQAYIWFSLVATTAIAFSLILLWPNQSTKQ